MIRVSTRKAMILILILCFIMVSGCEATGEDLGKNQGAFDKKSNSKWFEVYLIKDGQQPLIG